MSAVIYVLKDPETGDIRYVGKTSIPPAIRLRNHINQTSNKTHVAAWVGSLLRRGLKPLIEVIDNPDDWAAAEIFWIAEYRRRGADLTNLTVGGEHGNSLRGVPRSEETKRKCSESQRGRTLTAERKAKVSAGLRRHFANNPMSDGTKLKLSQAKKGRPKPPRSPEHCAKIAAKAKGRKWSAEAKARLSVIRKAYANTEAGKRRYERARIVTAKIFTGCDVNGQ